MHIRFLSSFVAFHLVCVGLSLGDEPAKPTGDKPPVVAAEEIRRLIANLDADTFHTREVASRRLFEIGEPALEHLDRVMRHPSAEMRQRAETVMQSILRAHDEVGFRELAVRPDDQIDIEYGMWLIARIVNNKVQRVELSKQFDDLAAQVQQRLGKGVDARRADPVQVVEAIRRVLFDDAKFIGNANDYHNPDNSLLDRVLATRKGLPILLSHVVVSVADRVGAPIVGLSTPGRYLVKYDGSRAPEGFARTDIFLDPYGGGAVLTRAEVQEQFPGLDPKDPIKPSGRRETLLRMLTNLETHLYEKGRNREAERVLACKLVLNGGR